MPTRSRESQWKERERNASSGGALRIRKVDRGPEPLRECRDVVVCPEVHEEEPRILVGQVVVEARDRDVVLAERLDDWIHLGADQHKVAGDRGLAAASRLEVDGRAEPHRWRDLEVAIARDG